MTSEPRPVPLRLEKLLGVLPAGEALRPWTAQLVASSSPDPERRWSTSGELGTTGDRLVDLETFRERTEAWVASETARLRRRARVVRTVGAALARQDSAEVVHLLLEESGALEAEGRHAEALDWAEAAARGPDVARSGRRAEALRRMARCARSLGRLEDAVAAYEAAWSVALDTDRPTDAVVAATGRGNVAVDRGRWVEAEGWYRRALELLDREAGAGISAQEASALRWRLHQNLGITHRERGDLEGSARWYARAEAESAASADPAAIVEIGNGRGQLALQEGRMRAAEIHFRSALAALEGRDPDPVRVAVGVNLADAMLHQGRVLEAGRIAREAEAEAIRGALVQRLPEVYRVMARIAREAGEEEAFVLVDRALEIVRAAGLPALEEARTWEVYAELRAAQGEPEVAREALQRAQAILRALAGPSGSTTEDSSREGDGG